MALLADVCLFHCTVVVSFMFTAVPLDPTGSPAFNDHSVHLCEQVGPPRKASGEKLHPMFLNPVRSSRNQVPLTKYAVQNAQEAGCTPENSQTPLPPPYPCPSCLKIAGVWRGLKQLLGAVPVDTGS